MAKPRVTPSITSEEVSRLCIDVPPMLRVPFEEAASLFNEVVAGQEPFRTWQQWIEPFRDPSPPLGLIGIWREHPGDYFNVLCRLHEAIIAIENFDPKHYYSKAVDRVAQGMRSRGKGGRKPTIELDKIAAWLRRRNYQLSDNKKALVIDAADRFGVSQSTVRAAASSAGLTRLKVAKKLTRL